MPRAFFVMIPFAADYGHCSIVGVCAECATNDDDWIMDAAKGLLGRYYSKIAALVTGHS